MGIRSILIIMTITGASDLSGAFAQSANVNDISSIIRGVTAEITDTIPEFNDNADIENDYVAGAESILDNIIYEGIKSEKKSVSSESVKGLMPENRSGLAGIPETPPVLIYILKFDTEARQ